MPAAATSTITSPGSLRSGSGTRACSSVSTSTKVMACMSFHPAMESAAEATYLGAMDAETREAFARIDRWFELSQAQHAESRAEMRQQNEALRTELRGEMRAQGDELRAEMRDMRTELSDRIDALTAEFRGFRDWVVAEFAEVRRQLRQLTARVEALERRLADRVG
jgi:DNA anti-recombination protein RmuC